MKNLANLKGAIALKKTLFLTAFVAVFMLSCDSNDENLKIETTSTKAKLVVFEDWKDFQNTSVELNESNSNDFISNWIIEKGHSALYNEELNAEDESDPFDLDKLTPALLAIFNKDLQFQVGDEVISYEKSIFYAQKNETDSREKIGEIKAYEIPIDNEANTKATNVWSNDGYAAVQNKEFTRYFHNKCNGSTEPQSSRRFKYKQQLRAYTYNWPITWEIVVWAEAKLLINKRSGSNSFKHDIGSRRNYTYNLSGNVKIFNIPYAFNINKNDYCIYGNTKVAKFNKTVLKQVHFLGHPGTANMVVTGTGTITHEVNGNNASEKWINQVNW